MRRWLQRLKLKLKRPSSTACLPANWEELGKDAAFRLAYLIDVFKICRRRVVNADEMSIELVPDNLKNRALTETGCRHVTIPGTGDKRNVTAMLAVNAEGEPLPAQIINKGTGDGSLPPADVVRQFEAEGGDITLSKNGWARKRTLKRYVTRVLAPYFMRVGGGPPTPPDSSGGGGSDGGVCVFILDVYKVHFSNSFRAWMRKEYPWIKLLYVPANCTSVLQPCDMALNKRVKQVTREAFCDDVVKALSNTADAAGAAGADPKKAADAAVQALLRIGSRRARLPGYISRALADAKTYPATIKGAWDKSWGTGWLDAAFCRESHQHLGRLFKFTSADGAQVAAENEPDGVEEAGQGQEDNTYQANNERITAALDRAAAPCLRQPKDKEDDDSEEEEATGGRGVGAGVGAGAGAGAAAAGAGGGAAAGAGGGSRRRRRTPRRTPRTTPTRWTATARATRSRQPRTSAARARATASWPRWSTPRATPPTRAAAAPLPPSAAST